MTFTRTPDEVVTIRSPFVGLVTDGFTRRPPAEAVSARLSEAWPASEPRDTGLVARMTRHGNLYFEDLAAPRPGSNLQHPYRIEVESRGRLALYPVGETAFRFSLSAQQPSAIVPMPMLPGPDYRYPQHLPVAHGVVRGGSPGDRLLVALEGSNEQCLTDESGAFSLCLRYTRPPLPITISATDRLNRVASQTFPTLAAATARAVLIDLPA